SPAYVRVPEGDESVSGRLPEAHEHVIQTLFRPTARNGIRRRLPNRKVGAKINGDFLYSIEYI
ncbi:MAG: hypothetical protein LBC19_04015, partial [Tannerella sp.]|nr:hypothetical protein [Tannerella sp.]